MMSKRIAAPDSSICVACGACIKVCPREAIRIFKGCCAIVDIEKCIGCGKCEKICPAGCITVKDREEI